MLPRRIDPVDNVRIASPCPATWERMAGDERVRHCTACDLNVYNFAEMSRAEVRELLIRTEGRVCARLYRRADGTLITRDCPTGLKTLRRRMSRVANAIAAAVVSVFAFGSGTANAAILRKPAVRLEAVKEPQAAAFSGTVVDEQGQAIPGVTIRLMNEESFRPVVVVTDGNGAFDVAELEYGTYTVQARLSGFAPTVETHLCLGGNTASRAAITLKSEAITVTVGVVAVDIGSGAPMDPPSTMTLTREQLRKLPF